jgi:hypothetical protein
MTSHNSVAKSVRLNKEKRPEFYCKAPGCLYRIETPLGHRECPKHIISVTPESLKHQAYTQGGVTFLQIEDKRHDARKELQQGHHSRAQSEQ